MSEFKQIQSKKGVDRSNANLDRYRGFSHQTLL
jgi:hypothetical protein